MARLGQTGPDWASQTPDWPVSCALWAGVAGPISTRGWGGTGRVRKLKKTINVLCFIYVCLQGGNFGGKLRKHFSLVCWTYLWLYFISTLTTLNTLRALLDGVVVLSAASVRVKRRREMRAGVCSNTTILPQIHRQSEMQEAYSRYCRILAFPMKSPVKTE